MKKSIQKDKLRQKVKNDTYKLSDQPLSKNKVWAFRIITIVLSVLFVFIFEAILHLSGFGHDLSLFAESKEDQSCWQMSEHAAGQPCSGFCRGAPFIHFSLIALEVRERKNLV